MRHRSRGFQPLLPIQQLSKQNIPKRVVRVYLIHIGTVFMESELINKWTLDLSDSEIFIEDWNRECGLNFRRYQRASTLLSTFDTISNCKIMFNVTYKNNICKKFHF